MDISKIKVGNTAYDVKDTAAREAIENIGEMASLTIDDKDATLSWGTKTTIAEIGETAIHVTLPSNPDTNIVTSVAGKTGDVTLGKSDVGLGNVDNTADANKLVLYAATAGSAPASDVYSWAKAENKPSYSYSEISNTPSSLPASDVYSWAKSATKPSYSFSEISGTVSSSQLPSYVDDVLEYDTKSGFPSLGEGGKIYVNKTDNTTWRWSGSAYVQIKGDLVIGTTSGTAYDGASGAALKSKLDGIESGAQVHKAPTSAEVKSALGTGSGTSKYLREDGTWVTPPNDNTWPTALSLLTNDVGYITSYTDTNTVTSINGKTGEIAAADMAAVLTAAGYKLTDTDTNTWRGVQCNSTSIGDNTLNLIAGTNVSLSRNGGNITISSTDTNTWPSALSQLSNDVGYITSYTNTVTSINGKTGEIAAADIATILTAAGYKLTDTNTWPSYTSLLTNNSGFITASDSCAYATSAGTAGKVQASIGDTGAYEILRGDMNNDQFRILIASDANNAGWAEIATADDGTEPIVVSQYTGVFTNLIRRAALLDGDGNTSFPGTVYSAGSPVITSANIGSQSVSYASSAGSAPASDVYSWAKASTKPSYSYSEISGTPSSLPASDVYSWAKASSKPSYTKSEIGLGNVDNTADSQKSVNYASSAGNSDTVDGYHIAVVTSMPSSPDANTIYIVK